MEGRGPLPGKSTPLRRRFMAWRRDIIMEPSAERHRTPNELLIAPTTAFREWLFVQRQR
jgi:hypothetical protein